MDAKSPLTKPTSNDQEGNTHCLMAQFPWQKSCALLNELSILPREGRELFPCCGLRGPVEAYWLVLSAPKDESSKEGEKTQHERF